MHNSSNNEKLALGQKYLSNGVRDYTNIENEAAKGDSFLHRLKRQFAKRSLFETFDVVQQVLSAKRDLRKCDLSGYQRVRGRVAVANYGGKIEIADRVFFDAKIVPIELAVHENAKIEIGERTYINYGVSIAAMELVHIGADCLIGPYVNILDDDFHGILDRHTPPPPQPVILEDNVWLGTRVLVLKGVTIGQDSVIGAGSVVTKNIPPRSIAVGFPAKVIRTF